MRASSFHRRKIFNDPVYGFIPIENELVFDIIEHPYFQRLRRIKQLGLTHLVYPGALHTRFHHSIGAMHLMNQVISALRLKGYDITDEEAIGASLAILLHDIGHGPFSHALEHTILEDVNHEDISKVYMQRLNEEFNGKLHRAIDIFSNTYKRKFLHQLVSSQLDMDRMDYLMRDSFYSGVLEGVINTDRIIKMMTVSDDKLAVEVKGIYSIEKYIIARRLMYWQVYLHKTVIAAESMLMHILKRAKYLVRKGEIIFTTPALLNFLKYSFQIEDLINDKKLLDLFSELDDFDIFASIKVWAKQSDYVLSMLCSNLINRHLFRIELQNTPFDKKYIEKIKSETQKIFKLSEDETEYLIITDSTANYAYHPMSDKINIILNSGEMIDIAKASDQLNISVLFKPVTKYFVCYPKIIQIVNN
ncbi:MAG: HD domain-containing protein [Bacteroidetes bacterium]|nr:HD domain-containing protein [Bacteroidota bacterium]